MKIITRCAEIHYHSFYRMHWTSWSRYVLVVVIILTLLIKETMQTCTVITTATTSIAASANSGCSTLTSVTISSTVTFIGEGLLLPHLFNYYNYLCTCFITTHDLYLLLWMFYMRDSDVVSLLIFYHIVYWCTHCSNK